MAAKRNLTLLLLIIFTNIIAQTKEFPIVGNWQMVSLTANNGNHDYTQKVENGQKLFFEDNNIVTDGSGAKGTYEFHENRLKIVLGTEKYYLAYYDLNDPDKIYLTPVTSNYQIICDEGCHDTYARLKDTK